MGGLNESDTAMGTSSTEELEDGSTPVRVKRGLADTAPSTRSRRDVLEEVLWTHHDKRHHGTYADCTQCTSVHVFFMDHPRYAPS